jgi:hypothetical protein
MPELVFFRRGEEVLRVGLERQRLVRGRGEASDVVVPEPYVSRQQVALLRDGPRCLQEDLSGQGTEVVGQLMRHGELPDGADLKLGQWRAVFRQRGTAGTAGHTRRGLMEGRSLWPRPASGTKILLGAMGDAWLRGAKHLGPHGNSADEEGGRPVRAQVATRAVAYKPLFFACSDSENSSVEL